MLWFFALTELTRLSRPKCLCEENLWCSGSEKISLQTGRKSPLACPLLARPFFLASTTSKRLLRKLENLLHIDIAPMHEENSFRDFTLKNWTIRPPAINLSIKCQHIKFSLRISTWAYYVAFVKKNIWIRDEVRVQESKAINLTSIANWSDISFGQKK